MWFILFFDVCLDLIYVIDIFPHSSGCYPHPDVPAVPKLRPVQREVVYCPDLRFMAYDIAVIHQSSTQSETEHDRSECIVEPVLMATPEERPGIHFPNELLETTPQQRHPK